MKEQSEAAPTVSDADTRALIESLRAICKRWNARAEKHRCGYQCNGADHDADKFASEIEDALEAASRSESTDARRVATPGFAEWVIMQACPVCNGRGFVSAAHYNVTGIGTTATTNAETCRTCGGKAIIPTGATGDPVTARAETDDQEAEVTHERK